MSWSRCLAALALALVVSACSFAPVYGPGGAGTRLQASIALSEPVGIPAYFVHRRLEERLGRGTRYSMSVSVSTRQQDLGVTSRGSVTRYRVIGTAQYDLIDPDTATSLLEGEIEAFTGYSTTGTTVATLAAQRDATERLGTILADLLIDELILSDLAP